MVGTIGMDQTSVDLHLPTPVGADELHAGKGEIRRDVHCEEGAHRRAQRLRDAHFVGGFFRLLRILRHELTQRHAQSNVQDPTAKTGLSRIDFLRIFFAFPG